MSNPNVGDIVEAVRPFALVCGAGYYSEEVCCSVELLVIVSLAGDMLWSATVYPGCVRTVRAGGAEETERAFMRFSQAYNHKPTPTPTPKHTGLPLPPRNRLRGRDRGRVG